MSINWTADELLDECHRLRQANIQLRLDLAEAELKLSTVVPDMAKRIAALEHIGKDNQHMLKDIQSIAKELM